MRVTVTYHFPSNTNESWFIDFISTDHEHLTQYFLRKGNELHLDADHINPDEIEELRVEAEDNLGATVRTIRE